MGGRIIRECDVSPEHWAALQEQIELAGRITAARHPETARPLAPDPRLEAPIAPEPAQSVVSEAAAILDQLNDGLNPSDRETADAALAVVILARCQALMDATKARLQS